MKPIKNSQSLILIGMPCSGKSTIGRLLAEKMQLEFVDTDQRIESYVNQKLQAFLDSKGYMALRAVEETILVNETFHNKIVATGGSAVYTHSGMMNLKSNALVVFLDLPENQLTKRMTNFSQRGIARKPNQSFSSLFKERRELYLRYMDIHVDCSGLSVDQLLAKLVGICKKELT
ncbi:MAG: shikimate kinase [Porticoccaceae bacterium]|nr:shikimate kinase [Porticoccaceae bacterium]